MTTFKITASTNGYIASRDIHFNGRTSYTVIDGLTEAKAKEKLEEFFCSDYENANFYETEEEFIFNMCYGKIEEQAECSGMEIEAYYQVTKKRWLTYFNNKSNSHRKFDGPGYYSPDYWGRIFGKGADSYEYDSRSYGIYEETEK